MENKKQYNQSFEDFVTKDVLDNCTDLEKEKLERIYTAVTALIEKYGAETTLNFGGTWQLDRDHFLNLIQYDQLEEFYIMLNEQVEDQALSSVLIAPDRTEFSEVYIMLPNNLKLIIKIQNALRDIQENHNVFRDMRPPFDTDSAD